MSQYFSIFSGYKTWIGATGLILIYVITTINQFHPLPPEFIILAQNSTNFFQALMGIGIGHKIVKLNDSLSE